MRIDALQLPEIKIFDPRILADTRGYFCETYSRRDFEKIGILCDFVQENWSFSAAVHTIRGLHYQLPPFEQHKLIRVIKGRIFDVAVDIRAASPTRGCWVGLELSADKCRQLLVPAGFAHGFCTLEPLTEVSYKVSSYYSPLHERGIRWNDPDIAIAWPVATDVVLSERDQLLPLLRNVTEWL